MDFEISQKILTTFFPGLRAEPLVLFFSKIGSKLAIIPLSRQLDGYFLSHELYAKEVIKKFRMSDCNPCQTPRCNDLKLCKFKEGDEKADEESYMSLIGSLIYLINSRPDLEYPVNLLSRFVSSPSTLHLEAAKHVLRYIKGTVTHGILYTKDLHPTLTGYCD